MAPTPRLLPPRRAPCPAARLREALPGTGLPGRATTAAAATAPRFAPPHRGAGAAAVARAGSSGSRRRGGPTRRRCLGRGAGGCLLADSAVARPGPLAGDGAAVGVRAALRPSAASCCCCWRLLWQAARAPPSLFLFGRAPFSLRATVPRPPPASGTLPPAAADPRGTLLRRRAGTRSGLAGYSGRLRIGARTVAAAAVVNPY